MAIASGLGGQVGIARETTYGTYVAPTRFLEVPEGVDLKESRTRTDIGVVAAGRLMKTGAHSVTTTLGGGGSLSLPVWNKGMGLLIQSLMGATATPTQQAATAAYLQTHTLSDVIGKSLTIQSGVPDTSGTVRPYTFLGCTVLGGEFTFEVENEVTAKFDLDAQKVDEAQSLVAASFVTGTRPFVGTDTSIKVGTFGAEAAVSGVTKATVKIGRAAKTDRYYFGAAGLKAAPLINEFAEITGTITADFVSKTDWADRFRSDATFSLVLEAVGPLIASTYYHTFRITLPGCRLDGDTPVLSGPDVVNGDFPFTCLFDGTNLPKIEIISTDTAL